MTRNEKKRFFERKKIQQLEAKNAFSQYKPMAALQQFIENPRKNEGFNVEGILLTIQQAYDITDNLQKNQIALYAAHALMIGNALMRLKEEIQHIFPKQWEQWAHANLQFIGVRNRQNWMALAKEPGVEEFKYLGVSALNLILSAIKGLYPSKSFTNRFRSFFNESTYPFQDYLPTNKVKKCLIIHTFEVNSKRSGITCDVGLLKPLADYENVLNDTLIEKLCQVQADGGSPEKHLERLIAGKGVVQKLTVKNNNVISRLSLDRSIAQTKEVTKAYLSDPQKLEDVDYANVEGVLALLVDLYWEKFTNDILREYL